ncbi:MAG: hypothetical protein KGI92_02895 [Alphaproteobacteria bacterium]|nr:hypothetical protein [Alphaproteobacteria bacterium]MDE1967830.1 hypothetical protein [Alphaproteobacteria bacterium]
MMANSAQREARNERIALEHERSILITKLRWMGLEQEADRMTAAGETPAAMTVPGETD